MKAHLSNSPIVLIGPIFLMEIQIAADVPTTSYIHRCNHPGRRMVKADEYAIEEPHPLEMISKR